MVIKEIYFWKENCEEIECFRVNECNGYVALSINGMTIAVDFDFKVE